MEFHEIANIFPMMTGDDYLELKNSIQEGYDKRYPIYTYEGKILDGRNRYTVCIDLGISPMYEVYDGDDPIRFVMLSNKDRRHLTAGQKAFAALEAEKMYAEEARKRQQGGQGGILLLENFPKANSEEPVHATEKAADLFGVNPHYITDAKKIEQEAPDIADKVKSGTWSMNRGKKEYKKRKKEIEREAMSNSGALVDLPIQASIITGDFRDIMKSMPENSIDLIFTDPPYDEKTIPLFSDLAHLGVRVLKPGGSLITYVGHYAIDKYMKLMTPHLRYWWILCLKHSGQSARLIGKNVFVEWKPLLWFVKEYRWNDEFVTDFYKSEPPEKKEHDWQQSISEARYYIEKLTPKNGVVLDPFVGSGTTILAAIDIERQGIGIELEEERANVARKRIADFAG